MDTHPPHPSLSDLQTLRSDVPLPIHRESNPWAWAVTGSPLAHMASQVGVGVFAAPKALRALPYMNPYVK